MPAAASNGKTVKKGNVPSPLFVASPFQRWTKQSIIHAIKNG
jgi:hypothetical protein